MFAAILVLGLRIHSVTCWATRTAPGTCYFLEIKLFLTCNISDHSSSQRLTVTCLVFLIITISWFSQRLLFRKTGIRKTWHVHCFSGTDVNRDRNKTHLLKLRYSKLHLLSFYQSQTFSRHRSKAAAC